MIRVNHHTSLPATEALDRALAGIRECSRVGRTSRTPSSDAQRVIHDEGHSTPTKKKIYEFPDIASSTKNVDDLQFFPTIEWCNIEEPVSEEEKSDVDTVVTDDTDGPSRKRLVRCISFKSQLSLLLNPVHGPATDALYTSILHGKWSEFASDFLEEM